MALTKGDLVQMNDVVYGAITKFYQKVIAPTMATKDDIKNMATKNDIAAIQEEMATKQDIVDSEERLTKRIDKLAEVVTLTKANHERRIRKLEDVVGVEPGARLII